MGRPTIRTMEDIRRQGGNLGVECPQCGRVSVFEIQGAIGYFRNRHWNTALEVAGRHFRCEGGMGGRGCGRKGARLWIAAPSERREVAQPVPIESRRRR